MKTNNRLLVLPICLIALLGALVSTGSYAADNDSDRNSHNTVDQIPVPVPLPKPVQQSDTNTCGSPRQIMSGEFIWNDTDIVLNGRPALYLTRHYRGFDAREGIFGKGWSTRCEKALIRAVGFTDADGNPTAEPVVRYVYRTENGKRYEFSESAPDQFARPDGLPGRSLTLGTNAVPQITFLDGSREIYNDIGRLSAEVDRNGNRVDYTYQNGVVTRMADTNDRFLELSYDSSGHVSSVSDHTGRSWTYTYNADGTLASVTDPLGGSKNYSYVPNQRSGDGFIYSAISQITDESGVVVVSIMYGDDGKVATYTMGENTYTYGIDRSGNVFKTDSLNSTWSYVTDELGRKTEVMPPVNIGSPMKYEYDSNGNITKFTELTNARNVPATEYTSTYDNLGRLTSSTTPDGTSTLQYQDSTPFVREASSPTGRTVQFAYDASGNPTRITDPAGNASTMQWNTNGDLISSADPLGNSSAQAYNAIGLVTQSTDPLNRSTGYVYDALGRLTQITDAAGENTMMEYDALDRMVRSTDALGHVTTYEYDPAGRLLSVTDAAGGITRFTFDIHGRTASEIRADGSIFTYAYRTDNLRSTMTDPRGVVTTYTYDIGKRMTRMDAIGAGINDAYTYTYDTLGRVLRAQSSASTVDYTYDALHRVSTETQDGRMTTHSYNAESELTGLNYEGEDLTYSYDNRGLLSTFVTPSGTHSYQHDAAGRLTNHTRPNGNTAIMSYDAVYQILEQDYTQVSGERYQYNYDNLGRISQIVGDGNADWSYQYDAIHRLTNADHEQNYPYQYDALGNRTENGGVYDLFNKLLEDNNYTYSYDEMGSLISKIDKSTGEISRYSYDGFARLNGFSKAASFGASNSIDTTYGYDAFGRRVSKSIDGLVTQFRWNAHNLIVEYENRTNKSAIYRYDGGYTSIEYTEKGITYDVLSDYIGTTKRLVDQLGNIQWRNQTSPYGASIESATTLPAAINFNQGFSGQYFDSESQNTYNYQRTYDSRTGRYLEPDRIGLGGGQNMYSYALSTPTTRSDPTGLEPMWTKMDAMAHYHKRGNDVTLGQIGLLSKIKNSPVTLDVLNNRFAGQISQAVQRSSNSCGSNTINVTFRNSYRFAKASDLSNDLWFIGGATLSGNFDGTVITSPMGEISYSGSATIKFHDVFTDPYDIFNSTAGETNIGGTPFNISDQWTKQYNGTIGANQ